MFKSATSWKCNLHLLFGTWKKLEKPSERSPMCLTWSRCTLSRFTPPVVVWMPYSCKAKGQKADPIWFPHWPTEILKKRENKKTNSFFSSTPPLAQICKSAFGELHVFTLYCNKLAHYPESGPSISFVIRSWEFPRWKFFPATNICYVWDLISDFFYFSCTFLYYAFY